MLKRLIKHGNNRAIVVDKAILKAAGIPEDAVFQISVNPSGGLAIQSFILLFFSIRGPAIVDLLYLVDFKFYRRDIAKKSGFSLLKLWKKLVFAFSILTLKSGLSSGLYYFSLLGSFC